MNVPCKICGESSPHANAGNLLPLCLKCEHDWQESPERAGFATARKRFIDRRRAGPTDPKPPISVSELQSMIGLWADKVFPDRTIHTTLAKLVLEEIPEFLISKARDPGEYADLLILILDAAHKQGIDAEAAVLRKHEKNTKRMWQRTDSGVYHNVGEFPRAEKAPPSLEER